MEKESLGSWTKAWRIIWWTLWTWWLVRCWWNWGTGFIYDVTADGSSRMKYQVYRALLSAQIQSHAAELIGLQYKRIMIQNIPSKQTKSYLRRRNVKEKNWVSLQTKLRAERSMNKQKQKVAAIKACQSISRDEHLVHLVMSMGFRLSNRSYVHV